MKVHWAAFCISRRRACAETSKWRKPLEEIGVKFGKDGFVVDWSCAKKSF